MNIKTLEVNLWLNTTNYNGNLKVRQTGEEYKFSYFVDPIKFFQQGIERGMPAEELMQLVNSWDINTLCAWLKNSNNFLYWQPGDRTISVFYDNHGYDLKNIRTTPSSLTKARVPDLVFRNTHIA